MSACPIARIATVSGTPAALAGLVQLVPDYFRVASTEFASDNPAIMSLRGRLWEQRGRFVLPLALALIVGSVLLLGAGSGWWWVPLLPFVIGLILAGAWFSRWHARVSESRERLPGVTSRLQLDYEAKPPDSIIDPACWYVRATRRDPYFGNDWALDLWSGTKEGIPVRGFSYECDVDGVFGQTWIAATPIDGVERPIAIVRHPHSVVLRSMLKQRPTMEVRIDEEFDRVFVVVCDDEAVARRFLGAAMREWFLTDAELDWYEVSPNELIVSMGVAGDPESELPELIDQLLAFRTNTPAVS